MAQTVVLALGHKYSDKVTKRATCDTTGIMTYTCSVCSEQYIKEIPATEHDYVAEVTVPNCTRMGYTTYTCSVCEDSYRTEFIPATGHSYQISWSSDEVAHYYTCTNCEDVKDYVEHIFGWIIDKVATTEEIGLKHEKCIVCNYTCNENTVIEKLKEEPQETHKHTLIKNRPNASTCTEEGNIEYYECADCGKYFSDNKATKEITLSETKIGKVKHTYISIVDVATTVKDGRIIEKCSICGHVASVINIAYPKTVNLSKISYIYTGKAIEPSVTIKDSIGKNIDSSNYTLKYKNNKNVGIAKVIIKFKGNYSGTISKIFTINPRQTTILKAVEKSKGFTVKWKKQTSQTTGYQIQYAQNKKFTKTKNITIGNKNKVLYSIFKISYGKTYYVRVRMYKTLRGKKFYSSWSNVEKIIIKTEKV